MIIAVFGASGRTGIPLLRHALEAGHEVRAATRTAGKIDIEHKNLTVIECDLTTREDVTKVIDGSDAVVSVIGHTKSSPDDLQTRAARFIIDGMNEANVKRLIVLTGAGVRFPEDSPGLFDHLIGFALKLLSRRILEDSKGYVEAVTSSNLDWTVVRAPVLTEQPSPGSYRVGYVGKGTGSRASRENVALFILDELAKNEHVKDAPMISD
jgi:putative NADH-flavin reductase